LKIIIHGTGDILEDGKVDFKDLTPAIEMVKRYEELAAAVKGAKNSLNLFKKPTDIELIELGKEAFDLIKALREAF